MWRLNPIAAQSDLADRSYELAEYIHGAECPLADRVGALCRLANKLSQAGFYSRALAMLEDIPPAARKVLAIAQRAKAYIAIVHLRRYIHR